MSNPAFGVSDSGRPRTQFEVDLSNNPDAVRACAQHLRVRLRDGRPDPVPERVEPPGRGNWARRQQVEYHRLRKELVELLGGACADCGITDTPDLMCVTTTPGVLAAQGVTSKLGRIHHLLAYPQLARLTCAQHLPNTTAITPSRLSLRERVHRAYGDKCSECPATSNLGIVRTGNTPPLRWSSGIPYTSREKLVWLVRHNFPKGWALRCPRHYRTPVR